MNAKLVKCIDNQEVPISPALVYLMNLPGERSKITQKHALDTIAAFASGGRLDCAAFPWHEMRYEHSIGIRAYLINRYKPATVNRMLACYRCTLRAAWRLRLMSADDYQRAADVKDVFNGYIPPGRELEPEEIRAILDACQDGSIKGRRDAAMLAILYGCGLRRSELAGLSLADYDCQESTLLIMGKGRKERLAYLQEGSQAALDDWLIVRGYLPGALFVPISQKRTIESVEMHICSETVRLVLVKRAQSVGVENVSPHDMRRTFVSNLLENGNDLAITATLAGHSSVQTTARYDRRPEEAKRSAANTLDVPYGKKAAIQIKHKAEVKK